MFFDQRTRYQRRILGDEVPLRVQCTSTSGVPSNPTAAPVMRILDVTGSVVVTKSIPPADKYGATGLFSYNQSLNSLFALGMYWVRYDYAVSGNNRADLECFEVVAGGNVSGQRISMFYMDRPSGGDWLVSQLDTGGLLMDRGPKL